MEQDGAALCEFFSWLEGALGKETITELTIDEHITAARARRPGFVCPSFGTIAGFKANWRALSPRSTVSNVVSAAVGSVLFPASRPCLC